MTYVAGGSHEGVRAWIGYTDEQVFKNLLNSEVIFLSKFIVKKIGTNIGMVLPNLYCPARLWSN